ncbi:GNAt family acetyltransferase [Pseudomonas syringae pv. syringae]|nr:GNAt family acetyltransferase [Pseudomonas syringae pv. syringae]
MADPIACMIMENDLLIGGATGRTEFQRLFVSYLWIDAGSRGKGLGAQTLNRLEALAIERGCTDALIETLDDDVARWYARCGYVPIACLPRYCGPWSRHTLLKSFGAQERI